MKIFATLCIIVCLWFYNVEASETCHPSISHNNEKVLAWSQNKSFITLVIKINETTSKVSVTLKERQTLLIHIGEFIKYFKLEAKVNWPGHMSITGNGAMTLLLMKKTPSLWSKENGIIADTTSESRPDYYPGVITSVAYVTLNSCLVRMNYTVETYNFIDVGRHIRIAKDIKAEVSKPYTPVPMLPIKEYSAPGELRDMTEGVNLLVKGYPNGKISDWLCTRNAGDSVFISNVMGEFNTKLVENVSTLYMFAAGTGITPMISVAVWALKSTTKRLHLNYFNKTFNETIWKDKLEELERAFPDRFSVEHILSQDSTWSGRKGHITLDMLTVLLPATYINNYVMVCGPRDYTTQIEKWLINDLQWDKKNFYTFYGSK